MNIYLKLFLTFFEIGAFSFGGGYAMIPVIREKCILNGWLTEEGIMNFIAVAESTPGPIAVNMATFVGSSQGGLAGSLLATLGVVLPSFLIIVLIASVMNNLIRYEGVKAALGGVQPVIVGLIVTTGTTMLLSVLFGIENVKSTFSIDYKSVIIFAVIAAAGMVYKKIRKKTISSIFMIILSAVMGIIMFGML
ncbi:MAG: chromate transporter [Clostridia bacterium]|nr:chromate transporter [Clostridia bacterium]